MINGFWKEDGSSYFDDKVPSIKKGRRWFLSPWEGDIFILEILTSLTNQQKCQLVGGTCRKFES